MLFPVDPKDFSRELEVRGAGVAQGVATGIAIELPEYCEAQVRPRSGLGLKHSITVNFGTIDPGYRGEIRVIMFNLGLADYVVNECGFGADLGAEKYFDIVMRLSGIQPAAAVLVVTVQSLRAQGEGKLESGFGNLAHRQNRRGWQAG